VQSRPPVHQSKLRSEEDAWFVTWVKATVFVF
jgi:hypothetical protein